MLSDRWFRGDLSLSQNEEVSALIAELRLALPPEHNREVREVLDEIRSCYPGKSISCDGIMYGTMGEATNIYQRYHSLSNDPDLEAKFERIIELIQANAKLSDFFEHLSKEDILSRLMLLRSAVLPFYTYDQDEAECDKSQYGAFYQNHLTEAIDAALAYLDCCFVLSSEPDSDDAWAEYLLGRSRFIESLPFCFDEIPSRGRLEFESCCTYVRRYFTNQGKDFDMNLKLLAEFGNLLEAYQNRLG